MKDTHKVRVTSLTRARRLKRKYDGVLSLHDLQMTSHRRLRFHRDPAPRHLTLLFDDVEDTSLASRGWVPPTHDHVQQALDFARKLDGNLLVHCHAGVSRSGALAYAILADTLGPGREDEAMKRLLEDRDCAVPNGLLVQLADDVMGRNGALVATYQAYLAASPKWQLRKTLQRKQFEKHQPSDFVKHYRL